MSPAIPCARLLSVKLKSVNIYKALVCMNIVMQSANLN
jgi:hypothetical protein